MAGDVDVLTPAQLGLATLSQLVDTALDGIAVLGPEGYRYRYVNPAGCRLLGRSLKDLVGQPALLFPLAPATDHPPSGMSTAKYAGREFEYVSAPVEADGTPLHVVRFRDVTDVRNQERRLKAFSRTSASIAFAGPLTTVLDRLAADVQHATGMVACTFLLMDSNGDLRQAGTSGEYPRVDDYAERLKACRALGAPLLALDAFETRTPVVVKGWRETTFADARFAPLHDISRQATWHTIAVVPLVVRDQIAGVFNGFYLKGHEPSEADVVFLTAIADQAAVAVDNARMLRELESKAALEERHRLARELHDSVSQALFSMTLQTRAVELSLSKDPPDPELVARGLAEVRELTQGALAEMRALIFQLRPDALHEEGLVSAIRKHAAAVEAKQALRIQVDASDSELVLAEDVEAQLFRVVQEALNNVVKHADAQSVNVRIGVAGPRGRDLVLEVGDDGCGFDTGAEHPGHLGLRSMAERVAQVGGSFHVDSHPAGSTTVHAVIPDAVGKLDRHGQR
jgi:signal transduction histidine kinase